MGNKNKSYNVLQGLLQYSFQNQELLDLALCHKSYGNQTNDKNNERLEFLGDAVLQLVVSNHLYRKLPNFKEGQLAKIRAMLVSQPTLAVQARALKLNEFIKVGKGEERTGARDRESLLCDVFEAVIGAIYLDGGLEKVEPIILAHLPKWDDKELARIDAKSTLQEHFQQKNQMTPVYELTEERGPDHDKLFAVEVRFQNEVLGKGLGKSKKEAAQAAARQALDTLEQDNSKEVGTKDDGS